MKQKRRRHVRDEAVICRKKSIIRSQAVALAFPIIHEIEDAALRKIFRLGKHSRLKGIRSRTKDTLAWNHALSMVVNHAPFTFVFSADGSDVG